MKKEIYPKLFTWLFVGLLITFIGGYSLSLNQELMYPLLTIGYIPIAITEIVVAIVLSARIYKMQPITAKILYILYSLLTGVTFSVIFVEFELQSVMSVFLVTSLLFGLLAFYGYITKRDLSKIGNILFIMLIGIIVVSIINIFVGSSSLSLGISILGVIIFMGYIIYDMNNIKYLENNIDEDKAAVYGAFQLYLDFINLFIRLLEFFGKRKD